MEDTRRNVFAEEDFLKQLCKHDRVFVETKKLVNRGRLGFWNTSCGQWIGRCVSRWQRIANRKKGTMAILMAIAQILCQQNKVCFPKWAIFSKKHVFFKKRFYSWKKIYRVWTMDSTLIVSFFKKCSDFFFNFWNFLLEILSSFHTTSHLVHISTM